MYILDLPLDPVINSGKFKGLFLGFPTNVIILLVTSTGKGGWTPMDIYIPGDSKWPFPQTLEVT